MYSLSDKDFILNVKIDVEDDECVELFENISHKHIEGMDLFISICEGKLNPIDLKKTRKKIRMINSELLKMVKANTNLYIDNEEYLNYEYLED